MAKELTCICRETHDLLHESGEAFTDKERLVQTFLKNLDIKGAKCDDDELPF